MEIFQKYYIYCSECGKTEEGLNTSYYTAELNFKGKGWQEIEGYNLCPECIAIINKDYKETIRKETTWCIADSSNNTDEIKCYTKNSTEWKNLYGD